LAKRIFGTNGIRGIFGDILTLNFICNISLAIATYFNKGTILIGYDCRHSSKLISKTICSVLNYYNLNCKLAGMIPTPCLQLSVKKLKYDGGIMVTASHNPPEYNGIKVISNDGIEISEQDQLKIEDIYFTQKWNPPKNFGITEIENRSIQTYIDAIKSNVNINRIILKKFTAVLDLGNGMQSITAPKICEDLGCKTIQINKNIDGSFPGRGSEPTTTNLAQLSNAVIKNKADFGVAFDGDGDRCIFCTDKGKIIPGANSALLLTDHILKQNPISTIITCVNTPSNIEKIALKTNSNVIRTKVGSVSVSRKMKSTNAIIGFEENGGFMFAPHLEVRDGAMSMALMLDMLSSSAKTLSQQISELPHVYIAKTKVFCPSNIGKKIILALKKTNYNFDELDGIKIFINKKSWIMIRLSGTEPLLRIYVESNSQKKLTAIISEYMNKINILQTTFLNQKLKHHTCKQMI